MRVKKLRILRFRQAISIRKLGIYAAFHFLYKSMKNKRNLANQFVVVIDRKSRNFAEKRAG